VAAKENFQLMDIKFENHKEFYAATREMDITLKENRPLEKYGGKKNAF